MEIKWISQLGTTASYGEGDCGMACLAMILDYHGQVFTVDQLSKMANYSEKFKYTNSQDMEVLALRLGIELKFKRFCTLEQIDKELSEDRPVVALVQYKYLPTRYSKTYDDNHFIILTGKNENTYLYSDPFWTRGGYNVKMTVGDFSLAWKNIYSSYGSYNAAMFTKSSKKIVTINDVTKMYELARHSRWTVEQAIREIELLNSHMARPRLLELIDQKTGPLYLLEKYFSEKKEELK
jgi:ABC-type bacteriocin/lantibiotic exporter with double-glycine peptidase domain